MIHSNDPMQKSFDISQAKDYKQQMQNNNRGLWVVKALTNENPTFVKGSSIDNQRVMPKIELVTPRKGYLPPILTKEDISMIPQSRVSNGSQNTVVPDQLDKLQSKMIQSQIQNVNFGSEEYPVPYNTRYTHSEPDCKRNLWPL